MTIDVSDVLLRVVVYGLPRLMPLASQLLDVIERDNGWIRFPESSINEILSDDIGWHYFFYDENAPIISDLMVGLIGNEKWAKFVSDASSGVDVESICDEIIVWFEAIFEKTRLGKETCASAADVPENEAGEADSKIISTEEVFDINQIATFYRLLSLMVHGEDLTSLVARAKTGDDDAFLKAIQIDKCILFGIDYFRMRYLRAQLGGEQEFITSVSNKLKEPPYKGKISHKKVWLSFAYLEQFGLLRLLDGNRLLDFVNEVGANDDDSPIEDVKNILKLRTRFLKFQSRGGVSTP